MEKDLQNQILFQNFYAQGDHFLIGQSLQKFEYFLTV
jgi:hypothetical protein